MHSYNKRFFNRFFLLMWFLDRPSRSSRRLTFTSAICHCCCVCFAPRPRPTWTWATLSCFYEAIDGIYTSWFVSKMVGTTDQAGQPSSPFSKFWVIILKTLLLLEKAYLNVAVHFPIVVYYYIILLLIYDIL